MLDGPSLRLQILQLLGSAADIKRAKELETFCWGGLGPVEEPPTPYNSLLDAVNATRSLANQFAAAHPDRADKVTEALAFFERFVAEIGDE